MTPEAFYKKYYPIVAKKVKGTPLHPETVMAQLVIEGGYKDKVPNNVYFGTKGSGELLNTTEEIDGVKKNVKRSFKEYGSFEESLDDYVNNILTNPVYKDSLSAKTPEQQIELIAKVGYASSSGYAELGKQVIKDNKSQIEKIMPRTNKTELLSETMNDDGKTKSIKVKLIDGTVKQYKIDKDSNFVPIGYGGYVFSADTDHHYKIPRDKDGSLSYHSGVNAQFGKIYDNEAKYVADRLHNAKDLTEDDFTAMQSIMNVDLASGDEKDAILKGLQKDFYLPIKENFENQQKESYNKEIKQLTIDKARLGVDDPKRQEIDNQIAQRKEFLNKKSQKDSLGGADDFLKSGEDTQKEFNNFVKNIRMENFGGQGGTQTVTSQDASQGGAGNGGSYKYSSSTSGYGNGSPSGNGTGLGDGQTLDETGIALDVETYSPDGSVVVKQQPLDRSGLEKSIAEDEALLGAMNTRRQETPFVYGPDSQPKHDVAGYIGDLAKVAIGMKGANAEIPTYETSPEFNAYMKDAFSRKDMGLLPQEKDYFNSQNELAYAYDVKNIHRLSGGSGGVALANLGRAANTMQEGLMKTAAVDASARDQNWMNFANAAGKGEQINRMKFEDSLSQAMMNKQAGAGLVSDALTNIGDRNQFEKAYGKGSASYEYQKYGAENIALNNQMLKDQKDMLYDNATRDLSESIRKKKEQLDLDASASVISATGDNYTPMAKQQYGQGIIDSITSKEYSPDGTVVGESSMTAKPKGEFADGMSVDQIKIMESKGEPVYPAVVNTKNFKVAKDNVTSKLDSKISQIKSDMNNNKVDKAIASAELKELQAKRTELLDKMTKEQEAWADSQFDENDKFVGGGDGMPDFTWLEEELKKY